MIRTHSWPENFGKIPGRKKNSNRKSISWIFSPFCEIYLFTFLHFWPVLRFSIPLCVILSSISNSQVKKNANLKNSNIFSIYFIVVFQFVFWNFFIQVGILQVTQICCIGFDFQVPTKPYLKSLDCIFKQIFLGSRQSPPLSKN